MSTATIDASMTRLENIKENKQMYNKNKIAEAEALAAEALRMANEAKLAAARLAEVKKTLSMFSNKLEKAEQSVQKDVEKSASVVEKETVEEAPVEEEPVEETPAIEEKAEIEVKEDPPLAPTEVVSESLVNDEVVKVVKTKPVEAEAAPKEPVAAIEAPARVVAQVPYKSDIVEDFLDGIGIGKMCGVDDEALGLTDKSTDKPIKPKIFTNPTKIEIKSVAIQDALRNPSLQEELATAERKAHNIADKTFQNTQVNEDFPDPFGVDHDDLVLCGKIADLCEPPVFDDDELEDMNDIKA